MRSEAEHNKPHQWPFCSAFAAGRSIRSWSAYLRFKAEQHVRHALVQSGCRGAMRLAQQSIQGEYCAV